jgi:L-arabinose isomerase
MWCEDQILRAALDVLPPLPVVVWVFLPSPRLGTFLEFERMLRFSGPVGALQASGMLKRELREYRTVVGHSADESVYANIETHARAMMARRRLRGARIGVLPFRCDQMSSTWIDEFGLRTRYGVELRYLEVTTLRTIAEEVSTAEVRAFVDEMQAARQSIEVDERNLVAGVRAAVALERLCERETLAALAINDVADELHRGLGMRPCLWNPRLSEADIVVSMEGEVAAGTAMLALRIATGEPPFYSEPLGSDLAANCLLLGHAGYHDALVGDESFPVRVIADEEYRRADPYTGAVTYFCCRPGPVTIVNSSWTGERLQWLVAEGESLPGGPRVAGNCHLLCRLDIPLGRFYSAAMEAGATQHWVVVPGHRSLDVAELCRWMHIESVDLA